MRTVLGGHNLHDVVGGRELGRAVGGGDAPHAVQACKQMADACEGIGAAYELACGPASGNGSLLLTNCSCTAGAGQALTAGCLRG